jgi:AcrR family transcriptional regulator
VASSQAASIGSPKPSDVTEPTTSVASPGPGTSGPADPFEGPGIAPRAATPATATTATTATTAGANSTTAARSANGTGSATQEARTTTSQRILDAALSSFAGRGYEATSLDAMAKGLEITKQSILYWLPSKDALLEAVIARSAQDLSEALESALARAGRGWDRVEAVVRSVFRLAARQPELLGLLREVGRLGPPAATQMTLALEPLVQRASSFLEGEMDAGTMRRHDPRLLLLAIYSTVIGMVTEVEVLRALGEEPTARSLVRRRADVLRLLRSALVIQPEG